MQENPPLKQFRWMLNESTESMHRISSWHTGIIYETLFLFNLLLLILWLTQLHSFSTISFCLILIRSELWHFYEQRFGKLSEMPYADYKLITASNMIINRSRKVKKSKKCWQRAASYNNIDEIKLKVILVLAYLLRLCNLFVSLDLSSFVKTVMAY